MNETVKMVVVLTLISAFSGGVLAGVRDFTKEGIEYQQLKYQKEPAIMAILDGASNDPMNERFRLQDGDLQVTVFPGIVDDRKVAVFETFGKGFAGEIGLMVGVDLGEDTIAAVGVTTHSETPGFGSRAKEEPFLADQFKGLPMTESVGVKKDGGGIDSISGATITSRGICVAVNSAEEIYKRIKPELVKHFASSAEGGQ